MPPTVTSPTDRQWNRVARTVVVTGVGVIAALEVAAEVFARHRRATRAAQGWLAGVERQEQRKVHLAELGYLARVFRSR